MSEHEDKYEALAQTLGVEALRALVPASPEKIAAALACGDEHLNGISLSAWDRAALGGESLTKPTKCPTCGGHVAPVNSYWSNDWPQRTLRATARSEPWKRSPGLSLAERVCVLKHVAKHHLAEMVK